MRVAVIQMVSGLDVATNLAQAERLVCEAARQNAELAVLPENFLTYGQANPDVGRIQSTFIPMLTELAVENGLTLVAGTVPFSEAAGAKPYAACFVFSPEGERLCRYDKIHLFDADVSDSTGQYRESDFYARGAKQGLVQACGTTLGLSVCYDLRFPEYYRLLSEAGAQLICVPSAFTEVTGRAHWEVLLRARAIENQCFVVAANQGGVHENGRATYGHSMVVNPWGEVVSRLETGEGCLVVDIDLREVGITRGKMPVQQHRVF